MLSQRKAGIDFAKHSFGKDIKNHQRYTYIRKCPLISVIKTSLDLTGKEWKFILDFLKRVQMHN